MKYLISLSFQLAATLALIAHAPLVSATDNDVGTWFILSITDRLPTPDGSSRWRYRLDAQARYSDVGSGNDQLMFRTGIGYDLSQTLAVWAGYARFRLHGSSSSTITEDRLWQDLSWRLHNWEQSSLSLRFRFELRSVSSGDDTGLVLRTQLKYVRKLATSDSASLVASLEPFINLRSTDWGATKGLSQQRSYLGVAWKLSKKSTFELGYQNQFFLVDNAENRMRHVATLYFKTKF